MKFYKENNVNPLGSCLPLVAQLPVFISLYYMLRQSLRSDICPQVQPHHLVKGVLTINGAAPTNPCGPHNGAGFLFISDLTNKATGIVLVVLILLYVGTQLVSSLMMSSPTMDKNQRYLMMGMPLVFVFIIIGFPAGVIVYWITTNTWTIAQQYVIRRRLGPVTKATAAAGAPVPAGARAAAPATGRASPTSSRARPESTGAAAATTTNGDGSGGIGGLLRGKGKRAEDAKTAVAEPPRQTKSSAPPPPPRKKKRRSGRRR